jgi:hypothetical protein
MTEGRSSPSPPNSSRIAPPKTPLDKPLIKKIVEARMAQNESELKS